MWRAGCSGQVPGADRTGPLGAEFEVLGFLRLQVLDGGTDRVIAFAAVHARRRGRGAPRQVDAAIGARLEHHAGLIVQEVVLVAQQDRSGSGRRGDRAGVVVVPAQADVDSHFSLSSMVSKA